MAVPVFESPCRNTGRSGEMYDWPAVNNAGLYFREPTAYKAFI